MVDVSTQLGADGVIDDDVLVEYLQAQRWYGAHGRDVHGATALDIVPLSEDRSLGIALVELRFDNGTHDLYQLLVAQHDGAVVEATGDPALTTRLVELTAERARVEGGDGCVTFEAIRPITPPAEPMATALGGEASNTVVVVDDLLVKTYRRVRAGVNAELDMLLFFAEHGFTKVPELAGWYAYEGERVQATLGLLQGFVPGAIDGWTLGQEELSKAADTFLDRLEQLGAVVGEMHSVLAAAGSDPDFAPEEPTPETASLVSARIDDEIDATFDELGDREEFAPLIGRRNQAHDVVLAAGPSVALGRNTRTHGDLHLGQVLWRAAKDRVDGWMIIDFEGEPARASTMRRQKAPPLRDVAGMLRSVSYLTGAAERSGVAVPEGWEAQARRRFLDGYRATAGSSVLPSSVEAQDHQIVVFELEKAFYELRYEVDHRPDWVDIPVRSIVGLLDGVDA
jgi:maltokinase